MSSFFEEKTLKIEEILQKFKLSINS